MINEFVYDVTHPRQLVRRAYAGWRTRDYWRDPERACGFVSSIFAVLSMAIGVEGILIRWLG